LAGLLARPALAQTTTFTYTGGNQAYTVPAGVTSLTVAATGASGGRFSSNTNFSFGARVQATVTVTPGEVLTVVVGGRGSTGTGRPVLGGFNGGGAGSDDGGGGGATDLRRTGTTTGDYLTGRNALVVAGGGGGSDIAPYTGGNGGTPNGGNGLSQGTVGGGGATQNAPGAAGGDAYPGSNNVGGAGSRASFGGGGGGGYYGGGGGGGNANLSGGGGGSSWAMPLSSNVSYNVATTTDVADGLLVITPVAINNLVVSTTTTIAPGAYNNITITGTGNGTLAGNVTVAGAFTVASGGTLNDGCNVISGGGSFTLAAGGTLGICAVQGIAAAGAIGAVQVTGTRSFASDASYVYNGTAAQSTGTGLPSQVRNLGTTNANTVTLSAATSVAQVLTVGAAGSLATGGKALTLLSSSAGTALVVNSGTGTITGAATVQRYIDPSLNSGLGYHYYSAPVSTTTLADLTTSGYSPEISQANLYNTSTTPGTTTPFPTLFAYDQSRVATTQNNLSAFDKGFVVPTSLNAPMTVGQGYLVQIGASQLVDFVGTPTTGNVPLALSRNAAGTANAPDAGWQLVGNPYPSPLDYSLVTAADRPGLDAAMYVVQSSSATTSSYRTYVNGQSTTAILNPLIASSQGFFVRVSAGQTNGLLTFRNAQRVTNYASQAAFQRTTADLRPAVRLALAGQGLTDAWVAYAETGATPTFDPQFDASKLPNSTGLNVSSVVGTERLAIDGRPAFTAGTILPLAVAVPTAGAYTLSATTLANLPAGLDAYLLDAQTGQVLRMSIGSNYNFSVTATAAQAPLVGRFTLQFATQAPLASAPALSATEATVYPNPAHESITILLPAVANTNTVQAELLNTLGQRVRQQSAPLPAAGARFTMPTAGLAPGVYVLRLTAGGTSQVQRVTIR